MRNKRVNEIAISGIFGAIILMLSFVPAPWGATMGFIRIGIAVEATIIHIPVIIGGIFGGKRVAVTLGFIFGLGSLIVAAMYATNIGIVFINPIVSVLPRVLFGYFIYLFYEGFNKIIPNKVVAMGLTFACSTLAHSVMVVTLLYVFASFYEGLLGGANIVDFFIVLISYNALLEIVLAVAIGTPIGMRIKAYRDLTIS